MRPLLFQIFMQSLITPTLDFWSFGLQFISLLLQYEIRHDMSTIHPLVSIHIPIHFTCKSVRTISAPFQPNIWYYAKFQSLQLFCTSQERCARTLTNIYHKYLIARLIYRIGSIHNNFSMVNTTRLLIKRRL